jgi:phenylacetate-CoA ligase
MTGRSGRERAASAERAERLRRLVGHAYERVPFYRERFDRAGVTPADIRSLDDLPRLPVTEKADLIDQPVEAIVARGVDPSSLVATLTSGYSGEPFLVRRTRREQGRWARGWLEDLIRAGLRTRDRVATLFSLRRERPEGTGPFAALGLVHETPIDCAGEPGEILEALEAARPTFLRGMAGVIARLADETARTGRGTIRPRVVWVSGEVLTPSARHRIETAFGAPVHNAYGTHEVGLVAADCRPSGLMHLGQPGLVVEVLGGDGRPVGAGDTGEVVVTALDFHAAPFIRYRLTDVVTRGPEPCPCGEPAPTLAHIEGRTIDYFEMPDGRTLHPYRILGPAIAVAPPVRQYQLVQEARDRIVLKLVCDEPLDEEGRRRLRESVEPLLGPGVGFRIETVPSIPVNPSGKSRPVLSLVGR